MLIQAVTEPVRAEWLMFSLMLTGLSDHDILEWWESGDIDGQGSPRRLWETGRFEIVEQAAGRIPTGHLPNPF
jgi:hypothetical protein